MAFVFVRSGSNSEDASGTTVTVTLAANVDAGDVVVAWCKWEGADTTLTMSGAGGGTWSNGTKENHTNGDLNGQFGYNLSATGGAATVTMTLAAARVFKRLHVWVFTPDSGETVSLDVQSTAEGSSTAPNSGNVTTTGTDEVVLGGYGEYSGATFSSPLINAVAAAGSIINSPAGSFSASWYRILTATFTGGAASGTIDASADWICNIISFKSEAAGGAGDMGRWGKTMRLIALRNQYNPS